MLRGNSSFRVWAGFALAATFVSVSLWLVGSVARCRAEIEERVDMIGHLGDLEGRYRALHQAVDPAAAEAMGVAPEDLLGYLLGEVEATRATIPATGDATTEVLPQLNGLERSARRLQEHHGAWLAARAAGEDPAPWIVAFHETIDAGVQELDHAVAVQRNATHAKSNALASMWNLTHGMLLAACLVAGLALWMVFRFQRTLAELRRVQTALRESEARLGTVAASAPIVLWSCDAEGIVTRSEGQGLRGLGLAPGEVVGRSVFDMYAGHAQVERNLRRCLAGETVVDEVDVDGTIFHGAHIPLRDDDGRVTGILGVSTDVTDLKHAERALRDSEQKRYESQKAEAIGRLAGGIAHEFSNLLTVVSGFSSLVHQSLSPNAPQRHDLDQVLKAAERAEQLTHQLLTFSRRHRSEPRVLDLRDVVAEGSKMLAALLGERIQLRIESAASPLHTLIDPGQFEQVIVNLALNARDAMPHGGVLTLELGKVRVEGGKHSVPDGNYASLLVRDNGLGMQEEVRRRIFEPFFTTKEPGKGTGLGLPTCEGIVRQLGGEISVHSAPGQGSTFRILLPRTDEAAAPLPDAEDPAPAPRGIETILLVEDEDLVRSFAARVLREQGYFVLEATDGERALDLSRGYGGVIELLVTDVVMPSLGGVEVAARLSRERPDIEVIFISGYPGEEVPGEDALEARTYLPKPFKAEELAQTVRAVLDGAPLTA